MLKAHIIKILTEQLGHQPTTSQKKMIHLIPDFITRGKDKDIMLVKGFAGTGKTSIIGALVRTMKILQNNVVLLAPTGRAAKVLSSYCKHNAYTIHKKIYRQKSTTDDTARFVLDKNLHKDTLFIVDEASMISNQSFESDIFGSGRLLDDLINYVNNKRNCRLVLVGDTAQLPPVGIDISPALDTEYLKGFGFNVQEVFLSEILRQAEDSGILFNAAGIRFNITDSSDRVPRILLEGFNDIERINGTELIEEITGSYDKYGMENTIVVTRSNKRANQFNKGIRDRILFREEELAAGDLLMVVRNNYFWLPENEITDFIANGDIMEIVRIRKYEEMYGFRFADALVRFIDYKNTELEVKLLLDTVYSETASLSSTQNKELFYSVMEDYAEISNKRKRFEKVRENPWFNALQVKFAYAVTCHKAQGGQWKNVFIDQGYITDEMINTEYLRWLYTAFTRPTEKLFLVNFSNHFFD
ncbi:MAG: AAA family ATPase [Bacteroidales bacterium]